MSTVISEATKAEIHALFGAYAEAWRANSAEQLLAHWDPSAAHPTYLAEEVDTPMTDLAAIEAYWKKNEGLHEQIELRYDQFSYHPLTDDLVQVVFQMRWDIRFRNFVSDAMGGDNRVVALVQRTSDGWKLTSWVEAPLAPILYFRRLYERDVRPEFLSGHPPK
ncbi:MAG: hypothetical protein AAGA23_01315 [Pseudomonadota bacterium]